MQLPHVAARFFLVLPVSGIIPTFIGSKKITMKKFIRARARSFSFAFAGLRELLFTEHNMWIHTLATIVVVAAGQWRGLSTGQWSFITLAIALVWMAEGFNTAIERLCNAVSREQHPIIKQVKDISAAAVLIAALAAAIIGLLVFFGS